MSRVALPPAQGIGGQLPFGQATSAIPNPGGAGNAFASAYDQNYKSALAMNQAMYGNILQGYQQTAAQQGSALNAVSQGYGDLANTVAGMQGQATGTYGQLAQQVPGMYAQAAGQAQGGEGALLRHYVNLGGDVLNSAGDALRQQQAGQSAVLGGYGQLQQGVMGTIQGIDASQRQAISDAYAQQQGATTQGLVGAGLNNTTVANSLARGNLLDKQKADIALSNQTAQLQAGYQSQLGLAGLNYAGQAVAQDTAQRNLGNQYQFQIGQLYGGALQQGTAQNLAAQQATAQAAGQYGSQYAGAQGQAAQSYGQYQGQALQNQYNSALANTAQANQQLGWMNTVQAPYPNPMAYAQGAYSAYQSDLATQAANRAQGQAAMGALGGRGVTTTMGAGSAAPPPWRGQVMSSGPSPADGNDRFFTPPTMYNDNWAGGPTPGTGAMLGAYDPYVTGQDAQWTQTPAGGYPAVSGTYQNPNAQAGDMTEADAAYAAAGAYA